VGSRSDAAKGELAVAVRVHQTARMISNLWDARRRKREDLKAKLCKSLRQLTNLLRTLISPPLDLFL
jgi:hypothetical protein